MRSVLGVLLAVPLLFSGGGQDKSKKTYELLYDDVQFLKQQVQRLDKRLDAAAGDIGAIAAIVRELAGQFKLFQADQARTQENIKSLPLQMQAFLDRLGEIETQLLRVTDDLSILKARPEAAPPPETPEEKAPKAEAKAPSQKKPGPAQKKAETAPDKKESDKKEADKPAPPKTHLSPQEVYNQAYADYQKGSYGLAIDGFKMFRDQFPGNPLADNAVYMIGECYYSQKKYEPAIESFDDIILNYPVSDKIGAAHWKKALALLELKKKDEAISVLKLLISAHPLEEEARSAQEKIKELQGIK
jgi:tol-pal system protein YbgF